MVATRPKRLKKNTFRSKVRDLKVGQSLKIGCLYTERLSAYQNAKAACPDSKFSTEKQADGTFLLIRVA